MFQWLQNNMLWLNMHIFEMRTRGFILLLDTTSPHLKKLQCTELYEVTKLKYYPTAKMWFLCHFIVVMGHLISQDVS